MSKRMTRISRLLPRTFFSAVIACGSIVFSTDISLAQDGGYSIFESAEESNEAPVVVSPKEAFSNPTAKLPKAQFGSFSNTDASESAPQLNGSKAVGTYANDGRSMFKRAPSSGSAGSGQLKPFASNSLRPENGPQPDDEASTSQAPPIVVGDFQKSARRLSSPPKASNSTAPTESRIAQVAFQDGGFAPMNRPQSNDAGSRFGQPPATNRFTQPPASSPNRFGDSPARTQQPLSPRPSQAMQPSQQPRSGFSGLRNSQNTQRPAARTATLPQQMRRAQPRTPATPVAKTGTKAAKELLTSWAEKRDSQLKLPGKRMTLQEFLAQPINGSRKDAINQYWVTFDDMANHKIAIEQSQWLNSIRNLRQAADQSVLKAAQQAAENSVLHTEIQLAKSQSMLHDFLPGFRYKNGKNIPVLPADIPWVGKLNTRYEEYRNRGMVPDKFNGIDEFLPKSRQLIANRADAVAAASQAAEQAKQSLMSGQTPVSNVLEAVRIKAKNQQDFLSTVTGYNRAITDYVLTVRQDIYQPDRLASVLIGRKAVQKSVARNETPQEDTDQFNGVSPTPAMRQASTSQNLSGRSAYQSSAMQNEDSKDDESGMGRSILSENTEQNSSNPSPFAKASSARQTQPATERFNYGPTKDSAAAANFDPSKVKEELPMQKAQQARGSAGYESNVAGGGTVAPARSASNAGTPRQPWDRSNMSNQPNQPAATRPVEERAGFPGSSTQPPSRFNQPAGGGSSPTQTPSRFTPINPSAPETGNPSKTNPFTPGNPGVTGTSIGDRTSDALGGGTFGSGSGTGQPPAKPASRFGSFGDSTRR